ncbi:DUF4748 domain-containing protein [Triplophysa rosa]|uniref:Hydrolase PNKD n=1 Tax=Triplophysa rosa TaxID=992332 RepID=A0A9W8C5G6_TRIRA|nr:DUF4748 domain-containing protein [Triplophysa rosa]KAI7807732.1 putative hydrolase PNKD [Triplophysa rosa]
MTHAHCTHTTKMAAPCRNLMRSAFEGLHQLSIRTLWVGSPFKCKIYHLGLQNVLHSRALHCRHFCLQTTSKTQEITSRQKPNEHEYKTAQQRKEEENEEGEDDNRPEYIPKRKAKNPMKKIGYAWMIGLPTGVIGFILAKRQVDKNRLKQLKVRQRMKKANEGDYDSERYKLATRVE